MPKPVIERRAVWSLPLRLCHWSLAAATLVLLLTGWLMGWAPERAEGVAEIHFVAAAVLTAALAARLGLLFLGRGPAAWRALVPDRHRLLQAGQVLRAYLTLGRLPLPRWYAHNPLWAPLYLLLFAVLLVQVVGGLLLLEQVTLVGGLSLRGLHQAGWQFLLWFGLLHVAAVFFHDARGDSAEISGMVNGRRCFTLEPLPPDTSGGPVVPLEALTRKRDKS